MRKIKNVLMLLTLSLLLIACDDGSANVGEDAKRNKITEEFQQEVINFSEEVLSHKEILDDHIELWITEGNSVGHFKEYNESYYEAFSEDVEEYIDFLDATSLSPTGSDEKGISKDIESSIKKQEKALKLYKKYLSNQKEKTKQDADILYDEGMAHMGDAIIDVGFPE